MVNELARSINIAFGGFPHHLPPVSTVALHPCPWCVEVNRATGHMRPIHRITKCNVCHNKTAIALPGLWPNVLKYSNPEGTAYDLR